MGRADLVMLSALEKRREQVPIEACSYLRYAN
jgi:hypothetical protein